MSPWQAMLLIVTITVSIVATTGLVCLFLVRTCSAIAQMLGTSLQTVISPGAPELPEPTPEPEVEPFKTPGWETWEPQNWTETPDSQRDDPVIGPQIP